MASKRSCICCGDKYSYCPSCGADRLKPAWYATFCSETCKELWETISRHSMGFIESKEAIKTIKALSLKDESKYTESVQRGIKILLAEKEKSTPVKKTKVKSSKSAPANTIKEEVISEIKSILTEESIPVEETIPVVEESHEVVESKEDE